MNSVVPTNQVPVQFLLRWAARAAGAVVIVTWVELVLIEWVRHGSPDLRNLAQPLQATVLAVVFAGYLIGWRNELVGGLLSIIGTLAFGILCTMTFGGLTSIALLWFAVPGLLYLLVWHGERRHGKLVL
jgi:hypothetical protein